MIQRHFVPHSPYLNVFIVTISFSILLMLDYDFFFTTAQPFSLSGKIFQASDFSAYKLISLYSFSTNNFNLWMKRSQKKWITNFLVAPATQWNHIKIWSFVIKCMHTLCMDYGWVCVSCCRCFWLDRNEKKNTRAYLWSMWASLKCWVNDNLCRFRP